MRFLQKYTLILYRFLENKQNNSLFKKPAMIKYLKSKNFLSANHGQYLHKISRIHMESILQNTPKLNVNDHNKDEDLYEDLDEDGFSLLNKLRNKQKESKDNEFNLENINSVFYKYINKDISEYYFDTEELSNDYEMTAMLQAYSALEEIKNKQTDIGKDLTYEEQKTIIDEKFKIFESKEKFKEHHATQPTILMKNLIKVNKLLKKNNTSEILEEILKQCPINKEEYNEIHQKTFIDNDPTLLIEKLNKSYNPILRLINLNMKDFFN